jgi:hypothetical protein
MRAPRPTVSSRVAFAGALVFFGVAGALWLDRPVASTDSDAARVLGGVATQGSALVESVLAAALRPLRFDLRVEAARAVLLVAWLLAAAVLARRVMPTMVAAGPAAFRDGRIASLLRWVIVALVLASAPVVGTFHLGGALVPLALLLALDELDHDARPALACVLAFAASLEGTPFALAALAGGIATLLRQRSALAALRALVPGLALALRALPIAERLNPLAFLAVMPPLPVAATPIDGVVIGLGTAGIVIAILRRAMPQPRVASEVLALVLVLPLVCLDRERFLGLDAATARAAVVLGLARPMAAAAAASFTLAGRDTLARYRRAFLGLAWLAFVARAGTDLAYRARETFAGADEARGLVTEIPENAVVLVDDDALLGRLVVARAVNALPASTTILRWSHESPTRLAAELDRDVALRPLARDLTLRGQGDPRTVFDLAKTRPTRSTAGAIWTADTATRLVPAGYFLRPLDEERESASAAKTPELDDKALEETLGALRDGRDRSANLEAHRLLCTEAALFAASGRKEIAGRYCHAMAPSAATVRCSICPNELRVSARDR